MRVHVYRTRKGKGKKEGTSKEAKKGRKQEGERGDAPRNDAGEAGVRARDDEERAKVLGADAHGGDVDCEADEAVDEPREHERVPLLQPVRPYCPPQERRRCFLGKGVRRCGKDT